jgi:diacylglycerol kinase family enzyme
VRNYGGVVLLPPEVSCDSGQLHVIGFRMRSRAAWLWQGLRGLCHRMRPSQDVLVRATTSVQIEGAAPHQIDGDAGGHGPATIDLLPVAARVFAPAAGT